MTLYLHEFIRRFLIHLLPKGFHRIWHYGLFANGNRADDIAPARKLLNVPPPVNEADNEKILVGCVPLCVPPTEAPRGAYRANG